MIKSIILLVLLKIKSIKRPTKDYVIKLICIVQQKLMFDQSQLDKLQPK